MGKNSKTRRTLDICKVWLGRMAVGKQKVTIRLHYDEELEVDKKKRTLKRERS